jgi:hypothetical protein
MVRETGTNFIWKMWSSVALMSGDAVVIKMPTSELTIVSPVTSSEVGNILAFTNGYIYCTLSAFYLAANTELDVTITGITNPQSFK